MQKIQTHIRQHVEKCSRICEIMRKSFISPTQCYSLIMRHQDEK